MVDEAARKRLVLALQACVDEGLTGSREQQLKAILLADSPNYARLHGNDLVRAGLVLVGTWRLWDILAETQS